MVILFVPVVTKFTFSVWSRERRAAFSSLFARLWLGSHMDRWFIVYKG